MLNGLKRTVLDFIIERQATNIKEENWGLIITEIMINFDFTWITSVNILQDILEAADVSRDIGIYTPAYIISNKAYTTNVVYNVKHKVIEETPRPIVGGNIFVRFISEEEAQKFLSIFFPDRADFEITYEGTGEVYQYKKAENFTIYL